MNAYRPQRLALTGATGALGYALLKRLFRLDPTVRASLLVRQQSEAFQSRPFQAWLTENRARVSLVEGDLRDEAYVFPAELLDADGGLWHFAAVTSLTAESAAVTRQIEQVNVEGTRRLVEAFLQGPRTGPFYHISTAYVAGRRSGKILETESAVGQTFRNPYEASKLASEQIVHQLFAAGAPGAIFRPSVVVDDEIGTGALKMVDACAYAVALATQRGEPFVFRQSVDSDLNDEV